MRVILSSPGFGERSVVGPAVRLLSRDESTRTEKPAVDILSPCLGVRFRRQKLGRRTRRPNESGRGCRPEVGARQQQLAVSFQLSLLPRGKYWHVNSRETEHLRVLIANERKDRLESIVTIVEGLGHTVVTRQLDVEEVAAATAELSPDLALVGLGETPSTRCSSSPGSCRRRPAP